MRLAFRLCLALGCPHPDYLLELLDGDQLADWAEYYSVEPWGFEAHDSWNGILATLIARSMGGSKTAVPKDFSLTGRVAETDSVDRLEGFLSGLVVEEKESTGE